MIQSLRNKSRSKILIADDDRAAILLLTEIFKADHEVYSTTRGNGVFEMAKEIQPDIILLDILMPDLDGFKVIIKLKVDESTSNIPVIFITALEDVQSETLGLKFGAMDYITKPVNPMIASLRVHNQLEMKRQKDILTRLSYLDGLTGCYNRRWFDKTLPIAWKESISEGKPMSLILLDVDYFKLYNDQYGHLAGDDCLKFIVNLVLPVLRRPADLCARYGGEEFIGILQHTDLSGAEFIAEKILKSINDSEMAHETSPLGKVTVSIGVATTYPNSDKSCKDLLQLTDQKLYQAKNSGRNRYASELLTSE